MNICTKKNKLIIQEPCGHCMFNYIINPHLLECQCGKTGGTICKHLKHYLVSKWNFDTMYTAILNMPHLRSWLKEQQPKVVCINTYCRDFLHSTDCCICLLPYVKAGHRWILNSNLMHTSINKEIELYQCLQCKELFHTGCYRKWNKDCPKCKYSRPEGPLLGASGTVCF